MKKHYLLIQLENISRSSQQAHHNFFGSIYSPVSKDNVLCSAFTSDDSWKKIPGMKYPTMNAERWKAMMSDKIVRPNGDTIESTFIAKGAPTQRAVTKTESAGRKGLIALQIQGKNL